jgi:hypothetical protein
MDAGTEVPQIRKTAPWTSAGHWLRLFNTWATPGQFEYRINVVYLLVYTNYT